MTKLPLKAGHNLCEAEQNKSMVFDQNCEPSAADAPRPPRFPRGITDRDILAKARGFVASDRATKAAAFYTQKLGFQVAPDVRSLASAVEMYEAQILQELLEDL